MYVRLFRKLPHRSETGYSFAQLPQQWVGTARAPRAQLNFAHSVFLTLFNLSRPNRSVVMSRGGFNEHSLRTNDEHSLTYLLDIHISSLAKGLFTFCPCFIGLLVFS